MGVGVGPVWVRFLVCGGVVAGCLPCRFVKFSLGQRRGGGVVVFVVVIVVAIINPVCGRKTRPFFTHLQLPSRR